MIDVIVARAMWARMVVNIIGGAVYTVVLGLTSYSGRLVMLQLNLAVVTCEQGDEA